jgi:hypothetical protein
MGNNSHCLHDRLLKVHGCQTNTKLRERPFNLKWRDNTRVRIFIFFCRAIGYMTKTLNQIFFFFLHQNQNIFFSFTGNQNSCKKCKTGKSPTPSVKISLSCTFAGVRFYISYPLEKVTMFTWITFLMTTFALTYCINCYELYNTTCSRDLRDIMWF